MRNIPTRPMRTSLPPRFLPYCCQPPCYCYCQTAWATTACIAASKTRTEALLYLFERVAITPTSRTKRARLRHRFELELSRASGKQIDLESAASDQLGASIRVTFWVAIARYSILCTRY